MTKRVDWDPVKRAREAAEKKRKAARERTAEASKQWYILPNGTWHRCTKGTRPPGALRPSVFHGRLKRESQVTEKAFPKSERGPNSDENQRA